MEPKLEERSDLDEEEEKHEATPEELGNALIKASAKGELETVRVLLQTGANVNFEDRKKWTPLLWASCQGHKEVVKALLEAGGLTYYRAIEETILHSKNLKASEVGKYTPLHWAAFNGHLKVVWLLVKSGFSPLVIDMFGNTAIHQAAAGDRVAVMECFLSFGVDINVKNARMHQPKDLATNPEVKELIKAARECPKCTQCQSYFDFTVIRYLCLVCKSFFCANCITQDWVYEEPTSDEQERPVTRCEKCLNFIREAEEKLMEALNVNEFEVVDQALEHVTSNKIDIDVKLLRRAKVEHERLKTEGIIRRAIEALQVVEDYKTILKAVNHLNFLLEDAKQRDVDIDTKIMTSVRTETDRLVAERNLRHQTLISPVSTAAPEDVARLEELVIKASGNNVEGKYIEEAKMLAEKMQKNIQAHNILRSFLDYPMREYPEVVVVDPRKRGAPAKAPPPPTPKKKKKEPKFPIPEWATDINSLVREVQELEKLMKEAPLFELTEDFLAQAKENITRMKKEIHFRQQQEEEARLAAEKKAAEKKKAKQGR